MKKSLLLMLALLLVAGGFAQDEQKQEKKKKAKKEKVYNEKGEIIKTGWNFGPLPVLGFDSDLGFQYGACVDIFNFGDGTRYPRYFYKFNVEVSRYTKNSGVFRFYADMPYLIKDTKLFFDLTYNYSPKFEFFGFNGYEAGRFDPVEDMIQKMQQLDPELDSASGYHFIKRNTLRFVGSMQHKLFVPNLNWVVGLAYYNVATDSLNLKKYEGQPTLYSSYVNAGIIKDNEKNGGNIAQLRLGLNYDSRDHNSDPSKGIYAEYTLTGSSNFIDGSKDYNSLIQTFIWRHYVPLYKDKLTFAYRLGVQHKIAGNTPWYMINNINMPFFQKMYTEGLGGVVTMRGVNRNGVLGDGFVLGNVELRWHFLDFKFINQNWQLAFSPFFDAGMIIQPFREEELKNASIEDVPLYSGEKESFHTSAGGGIKIIMNRNMILGVDVGRALDNRDGDKFKVFVGFNYIF